MPTFSSTDERLSTAVAGQYEIEREIGRGGMGASVDAFRSTRPSRRP